LTSYGDQDVLVARFDAQGRLRGAERFGGPKLDYATGAAIDGQSNIVLTGSATGPVDFFSGSIVGGGGRDAFVTTFVIPDRDTAPSLSSRAAVMEPEGDLGWTRSFGGPRWEDSRAVTIDASGNIILTGTFVDTLHWGPSQIQGFGYADVYVSKLDGNGNPIWSVAVGDHEVQTGPVIAADQDGNVFLGSEWRPYQLELARRNDPNDRVVIKIGPSGEEQWRRKLVGQTGPILLTDSTGNLLAITSTSLSTDLVQFDPAGGVVWRHKIPDHQFVLVHDAQKLECFARIVQEKADSADSRVRGRLRVESFS
jgi:hypothetical protein